MIKDKNQKNHWWVDLVENIINKKIEILPLTKKITRDFVEDSTLFTEYKKIENCDNGYASEPISYYLLPLKMKNKDQLFILSDSQADKVKKYGNDISDNGLGFKVRKVGFTRCTKAEGIYYYITHEFGLNMGGGDLYLINKGESSQLRLYKTIWVS